MRTGVDIIEIKRLKKHLLNEQFMNKIFTKYEIQHIMQHSTIKGQLERMAGKYCAKEAIAKALGFGISKGVGFKNIEINHDANNRPYVSLTGIAKEIFDSIGTQLDLSISHDAGMAIAFCIIL